MSRAGAGNGPAARRRAAFDLVERFAVLHADGDLAGCAALLARDARGQSTLVAGNVPVDGADAAAALLEGAGALWARSQETVTAIGAGPDAGWIETRVEGTTAAGAAATLEAVTVLGVDGEGRIASVRVYADTTAFALGAGAAGAPPLLTGGPEGEQPAPASGHAALIARYFGLVGAGEIDAVVACFEEDGSFQPPPAPEPFRGHAAIRGFFEGLIPMFAHRHEWTTRVVVDGEAGLAELVFEAELHDGRHVRFENCNVFRFRGGRFGDVRVYGDAAGMRAQLAPPA